MGYLCNYCKSWKFDGSSLLCEECSHFWNIQKNAMTPLKNSADCKNQIDIAYPYNDFTRKLVLEAKVNGDPHSQRVLLHLGSRFFHELIQTRDFSWVEAVCPAPSSLWSRWHGKSDIAFEIALCLSKILRKKLISSPLALSWTIRKRSKNKQFQSNLRTLNWKAQGPHQPKILFVDDVVTTGLTLNNLAQYFNQSPANAFVFAGKIKRS